VKNHKVSAVGALLATAFALAGCGLADEPVKESANGGVDSAKGAPAVPVEAVDACKLLTAAELKEAFGKAAGKPHGGSTTIDEPVRMTNSNCIHAAEGGAVPFDVYVIVQQYGTEKSGDDIKSEGATPVSGVGEAAVSEEAVVGGPSGPPTTQVRFVVDNKLVNVSKVYKDDRTPDDPAADVRSVIDLAKKVASRL
jgi:hypothetical protein